MNFCPHCGNALVRRQLDGEERACCPEATCGFVLWDNPTPVIAALVEVDGQVLLARNAAWRRGIFSVITGYLERGETPEECALREVSEELGLDGRIAGYIGHYAFVDKNQLILAFHVIASGEVRLSSELLEYRLIAKEKIKPWLFGTGPAVRDWLISQGVRDPQSLPDSLPLSIPNS